MNNNNNTLITYMQQITHNMIREEPMRQGPLLNIVQSWGFQTATMFMVLSEGHMASEPF